MELSAFALSPSLVAVARANTIQSIGALFAGSVWRLEVGTPGVLVAMSTHGPAMLQYGVVSSWMLHGAQTSAGTTLSVQKLPASDEDNAEYSDDGDDGEVAYRPPAEPQTMVELEVRLVLREACRGSPALRRACSKAFAAESPLFIQDWFGIVPQAALTAD